MEPTLCIFCHKPKANLACGLCSSAVCKKCAQFIPDDSFSFLNEIPAHLAHDVYCPHCFDAQVSVDLQSYQKSLERAREVFVFYKTQSKETRTLKRKEEALRIVNCVDRNEALLRLAFMAVQADFNTLIDVVLTSDKVITNGYQKANWRGVGIPVKVDPNSRLLQNWEFRD